MLDHSAKAFIVISTNQEIRREIKDVKPIKISTPHPIDSLPREIITKLQLVTLADLLQGFKDIYNKPTQDLRITREIAKKLKEKGQRGLQVDPDEVFDQFVADQLELTDEFYDGDFSNTVTFQD